jgi:hypothetical protein
LDDSGKIKTNILGISTCSENQYCYYGERGCSDVAPISQELLGVCKASLEKTGKTFNQAEDCSIDRTNCKVTNSPCYCVNNAGTKALCSQNQYCYYREMGCQEFGPGQKSILQSRTNQQLCESSLTKYNSENPAVPAFF